MRAHLFVCGGTYVVVPCFAVSILVEVELDTRVISFVSTWELDTFRCSSAITLDLDVEAMSEKLWPSDSIHCDVVAVESDELGSKNVHPRLDITWKFEGINVPVINDLLILP
jgi:hypothetical protein